MNILRVVLLFFLVLAPAVHPASAQTLILPSAMQGTIQGAVESADYRIGAGDQLGIEVWKDPTMTRTVVVLADGKINLPLVGEVMASERTVGELKKEIEQRLAPFIPQPVLTVEVKQCNSLYVFVMGRVNNPGRSALIARTNVLQALAMAGGPNAFANRDKIKIFRSQGGATRILDFDYDEVTAGRQLEQNVELSRGDVIFVP